MCFRSPCAKTPAHHVYQRLARSRTLCASSLLRLGASLTRHFLGSSACSVLAVVPLAGSILAHPISRCRQRADLYATTTRHLFLPNTIVAFLSMIANCIFLGTPHHPWRNHVSFLHSSSLAFSYSTCGWSCRFVPPLPCHAHLLPKSVHRSLPNRSNFISGRYPMPTNANRSSQTSISAT